MVEPAFSTEGLRPVYRLRTPTAAQRLTVGALGATTAATLSRLVNGSRDTADVVVGVVLVIACLTALVLHLTRPPAISVTADGVRLRTFLRFGPLVPWAEVADVRAAGRWDEHPSIRLPQGGNLRRIPLLGMPAEDAERLAAAFARSRS